MKERYKSIAPILILTLFFLLALAFFWHSNAKATVMTSFTISSQSEFNQGPRTNTIVTGTNDAAYIHLPNRLSDSWYDLNWSTRQKLTINNSNVTENLTNFTVLVHFSASNVDYSKIRSDGADVLFTDSNGTTLLASRVIAWEDNGDSYYWVNIPSITASPAAEYFYIYYGNSSCTTALNLDGKVNGVTIPANANTILSYDMDETSGNLTDVSANALTGVNSGTTSTTGIISKGRLFNGGSFIDAGNPAAVNPSSAITIELWIKPTTISGNHSFVGKWYYYSGSVRQYSLGTSATKEIGFGVISDSNALTSATNVLTTDTWIHITVVYDGTNSYIYKNGVQIASKSVTGAIPALGASLNIGRDPVPAGSYFIGSMDELHMSSVAHSASWVNTLYKSESDTLISIGSTKETAITEGFWESPSTASEVYDLGWNGGWGDGSDSSTAFSASVANVGSNASVIFQMRTASQLADLTSAAYTTLGTASSGSTFSLTKAEMDALGVATGHNRYIQVKTILHTANVTFDPQLNDFTVTYLKDNTAPEGNLSNLKMFNTNGGAEITNGEWANNVAPYFTWDAATDSQSDIKGYCVYIGTSDTADPGQSKGLLGTSPVSTTGSTCQFIVGTNSLDLATAASRGSTWLASATTPYFISIKPIDIANNIGDTAVQFSFYFDNTPPKNPDFISLPGGFVSAKEVTFTWPVTGASASIDTHSQLAGLQYRIGSSGTWYGDSHNGHQDSTDLLTDDGAYTMQDPIDFNVLQEGNNMIYIRAWDNAGNVTTTYITGAIKINTIAPGQPENLKVTPASNTENSYAFEWEQPASFSGQGSSITYCYTINTLPSSSTCAFTAAGQTSLTTGPYATQPGKNTMYVVAKDEASNINYDAYASVSFSYTGSAPGVPIGVDIADISVKANQSWKLALSWEAPVDQGAGIASYKIYRSTTATSCSSNIGSFTTAGKTAGTAFTDVGLQQKTYYYCVQACDSANNCGAYSTTVSEYPDGRYTTPPVLSNGPTVTALKTRSATITWLTDREGDSKIAYGLKSGQYYQDEIARSAFTQNHAITLTNLKPDTVYFFVAKWTDEDGNTGISTERSFKTSPAPVIQNVKVSYLGIDQALLNFVSSRAVKVKVYYGPKGNMTSSQTLNTSTATSTYTVSLTDLKDDTAYAYRLNPIDEDGYEYEGDFYQFTTLPRPRISDVQMEEIKNVAQPTMKVTWKSNTGITSMIEYYDGTDKKDVRSVIDVKLVKEHALTIPGLKAETLYKLRVIGVDKLGNKAQSDEYAFTTATDSRPPSISNIKISGTIAKTAKDKSTSAQVLISWDTDEPASSQVEFGKGSGNTYTSSSQKEYSYTSNHFIVISDLQPSRVYHIRVISIDQAGNESYSEDIVSITPKTTTSALNLVVDNILDIFTF